MKDFIGCNLEFAMFFTSVICWFECNYSIAFEQAIFCLLIILFGITQFVHSMKTLEDKQCFEVAFICKYKIFII